MASSSLLVAAARAVTRWISPLTERSQILLDRGDLGQVSGVALGVALIHPDNRASQRVAEKIGLRLTKEDPGVNGPRVRLVYSTRL